MWLLGIGEIDAELRAAAQKLPEGRQIMRRRNDQDIPDVGQHEGAQRVIDERLVEYREQLL